MKYIYDPEMNHSVNSNDALLEKNTQNNTHPEDYIEIIGANENNLRDVTVKIPRNQMVVVTGLSGSGKSSLAFDTLYAEGQRRYMETFSAYARQFIGSMDRPDVEKIDGLSPVISIEQKTTAWNPRSTVGTTTEIYDFLRLLYARTGEAYSYVTGEKMIKYTEEQVIDHVLAYFKDKRIAILAPVVRARKGHYRELFDQTRKKGFTKVRIDGEIVDLTPGLQVDRYKIHDIEIVVDRIKVEEDKRDRLVSSIEMGMRMGNDFIMVMNIDTSEIKAYSKSLMDPESGLSYDEPSPNNFSFNTPYGYCPVCIGLGEKQEADLNKIIPDWDRSIKEEGIRPFGQVRDNSTFKQLKKIAKDFKFTFDTPIKDIPKVALDMILYGKQDGSKSYTAVYNDYMYDLAQEGIVNMIERWYKESTSEKIRSWAEEFLSIVTCPECNGYRLKKESLHFKLGGKHVGMLAEMNISELYDWIEELPAHLDEKQNVIAHEIIKEIRMRLGFLLEVGLGYLSLNRTTRSLSGGESQRTRLASQIGSQLTGITYIMDEPSIGLHQRDNQRLIKALHGLTEIGNTVLVVEHDKDIMLASDYIIDLGPGAGTLGGKVVAQGKPEEFIKNQSVTADYLADRIRIEIPKKRRKGNGFFLELKGATGHNLKNADIKLPLGTLICVAGVSGSGKSSLINETLYPILRHHFYKSLQKPLPYKSIEGLEYIDKVIEIDQSPIGRTPRSNPATYTGVFTDIRKLFGNTPEAKIRGYQMGRFSFNVAGGRCETCGGAGKKLIEMNFLPDVLVDCETCLGKRYNSETLEILYKGKSISDILEMSVREANEFFSNVPSIHRKLKTINDVGLGYITLGQQATTLSGGEAQRVKLAEELSKRDTGKTFYILDEPTTGLHFDDIKQLLKVLQKLVDKGNTVLIIEHNMDVIKVADYIIDLGPDGGNKGGEIVAKGTPEQVAKVKNNFTAEYLRKEL
ncbi:MAG: excinuclease ABC subunit UvrA [Chitinophagales bacterium]|nr:excinuclease ABC subunit UvrA [Chitinophagales bacterium]